MSPTLGMNGGVPLGDLANSSGAAASIDAIVHGLSSVASVSKRNTDGTDENSEKSRPGV